MSSVNHILERHHENGSKKSKEQTSNWWRKWNENTILDHIYVELLSSDIILTLKHDQTYEWDFGTNNEYHLQARKNKDWSFTLLSAYPKKPNSWVSIKWGKETKKSLEEVEFAKELEESKTFPEIETGWLWDLDQDWDGKLDEVNVSNTWRLRHLDNLNISPENKTAINNLVEDSRVNWWIEATRTKYMNALWLSTEQVKIANATHEKNNIDYKLKALIMQWRISVVWEKVFLKDGEIMQDITDRGYVKKSTLAEVESLLSEIKDLWSINEDSALLLIADRVCGKQKKNHHESYQSFPQIVSDLELLGFTNAEIEKAYNKVYKIFDYQEFSTETEKYDFIKEVLQKIIHKMRKKQIRGNSSEKKNKKNGWWPDVKPKKLEKIEDGISWKPDYQRKDTLLKRTKKNKVVLLTVEESTEVKEQIRNEMLNALVDNDPNYVQQYVEINDIIATSNSVDMLKSKKNKWFQKWNKISNKTKK